MMFCVLRAPGSLYGCHKYAKDPRVFPPSKQHSREVTGQVSRQGARWVNGGRGKTPDTARKKRTRWAQLPDFQSAALVEEVTCLVHISRVQTLKTITQIQANNNAEVYSAASKTLLTLLLPH